MGKWRAWLNNSEYQRPKHLKLGIFDICILRHTFKDSFMFFYVLLCSFTDEGSFMFFYVLLRMKVQPNLAAQTVLLSLTIAFDSIVLLLTISFKLRSFVRLSVCETVGWGSL